MTKALSRTAAMAQGAVVGFLAPRLAQDAKIDLAPVFAGVTKKNYVLRRPEIIGGVAKATAGKLAQDAKLDELDAVLMALDAMLPDDEPEKKEKAEDADTPDNFLKGKLSEDDFAAYKAKCDSAAKDSEEEDDPEDKGKKPPLGSKKAVADKAKDSESEKEKAEDEDDDPKAMDEKIKDAVLAERNRSRGVAEAEKFVRPWVGELLVAMDSAEDVYKKALTMVGKKSSELDRIHPSAYRALLEAQPKPGQRNRDHFSGTLAMGMDSSNREAAVKIAPGLERLRIGA